MICPKCQTRVSDDAVICDSCNAILDATFLGEDITNEAGAAEAAPPADATRIKAVDSQATRVKALPPERPKADANATRVKAAPVEPPPGTKKKTIIETVSHDDDDDGAPAQGPGQRIAAFVEAAAPPAETAQAMDELVAQFRALPFSERLTAGAALGVLFTMAMPWRWTKDEGDFIGLATKAWPIALMAVLVAAAVFVRRHPVLRAWKDRILQLSAGLAGLSLLVAVAFWQTVEVTHDLRAGGRRFTVTDESSAFGVFLGMAACAVMVLGTAKSYLDRHDLPD